MTRAGLVGAALVVMLQLPACAGSKPSEYARLDAAATRAHSAGRYEEAAARWEEAAHAARARRNRSEARYNEASSFLRAGQQSKALRIFDEMLADDPNGERAARAAYDRAVTLIALGESDRGYKAMEATLYTHPESGVAPSALRRYLGWVGRGGDEAIRQYLDVAIGRLAGTELAQFAEYAYAESLGRDGQLRAARDRYLVVARKYPYPHGALWDDSLFHAADLDAKLGDPKAAISHLEQMLAQRETSYMSGSYERGRYAEARYRIGELYRDALGDPASARIAFERLFADHKTSRLRDDAAWNAALLAMKTGDAAGACRNLAALIAVIPDSRFAPCAPRLCPALESKSPKRKCAAYIVSAVSAR